MALASGALAQQKQARIVALLPPAPKGWRLSVNEDDTANLAMAGGGDGTEASSSDPSGNTLTLSITADSPMMTMGMAGIFMNEQMLARVGKRSETPGAKLLEQDNSLMTQIDQRILVNISGLPVEQMMPIVEQIDFEPLAAFDSAP